MITTAADAPAWLRRSDQAVTWARTRLPSSYPIAHRQLDEPD
jgi:hypothetical protein